MACVSKTYSHIWKHFHIIFPYMACSHCYLTYQCVTYLQLPWVAYFYVIYRISMKSVAHLLICVYSEHKFIEVIQVKGRN